MVIEYCHSDSGLLRPPPPSHLPVVLGFLEGSSHYVTQAGLGWGILLPQPQPLSVGIRRVLYRGGQFSLFTEALIVYRRISV